MNCDDMRDEYDFSNAERSKFHQPNASLAPPLDLEPEVLAFLTAGAEARGITLSELVNTLLKIQSFGDRPTEALFRDERVRQFAGIARAAKRIEPAGETQGRPEGLSFDPDQRSMADYS
jgi:hypothetical protein